MSNLIAFLNMFLSYILLMAIIVVIAAAAVAIGITLRKRKNSQAKDGMENPDGEP